VLKIMQCGCNFGGGNMVEEIGEKRRDGNTRRYCNRNATPRKRRHG